MDKTLRTKVARNVARPYRIWNTATKKDMRWRYYADPKRCQMGALMECRWAEVGVTLEVYDARTTKLICTYTRRVSTIMFMEP